MANNLGVYAPVTVIFDKLAPQLLIGVINSGEYMRVIAVLIMMAVSACSKQEHYPICQNYIGWEGVPINLDRNDPEADGRRSVKNNSHILYILRNEYSGYIIPADNKYHNEISKLESGQYNYRGKKFDITTPYQLNCIYNNKNYSEKLMIYAKRFNSTVFDMTYR